MTVRVGVPDAETASRLTARLGSDAEIEPWRPGDDPIPGLDILVLPYLSPWSELGRLGGQQARLLQSQMLGYDGAAAHLPPGHLFSNAVGVHEGPTAELALALVLASQRGLADAVRAAESGKQHRTTYPGLAGTRVLLVGAGGVSGEIVARLLPFDVELVRVGRRARTDRFGEVLGVDQLDRLLPDADVVILAVPLTADTSKLFDAARLGRMRRNALLVNVSRGGVVDTDALADVAASGGIRVAVDVTDPEPLPPDHPLWRAPGTIITPHVGGDTGSMSKRMDVLVAEQVRRAIAAEPFLHVVIDTM